MDTLAGEAWVARSERSWWPRFFFHYTDVQNAVSILGSGALYSRKEVVRRKLLSVSSGDSEILEETHDSILDCVRLYFRPKTPFQYHVEGIKPRHQVEESKYPGAHCPVPVFLLFDSAKVLTREDCRFCNGSARYVTYESLSSTSEELGQFPWQNVYHNAPHDPARRDIVAAKMAEILIPKTLSLDSLRYIYCRSIAEKETLLGLLSSDAWETYHKVITASQRYRLFYPDRTYVRSCALSDELASIEFSPDTAYPGPYHLVVTITTRWNVLHYERQDYVANSSLRLQLPAKYSQYHLRVELDGYLAYDAEYVKIPF